MKTKLILLSISVFVLTSYDPVMDYEPVTYQPILLEREVLENSLRFESMPGMIEDAGKIYVYQDYLFINDRFKGVYVYDNSSPKSPKQVGMIKIPGCIDIAIKDNILYADNAVDLIAVDISDARNPQEVKRIKEVFPELAPPGQNYLPYTFSREERPAETVIIDWIEQ